MKYYYLNTDKLKNNQIYILKQTDTPVEDYASVLGQNVLEYITDDGKNIPNNWGYLEDSKILYDKSDAPSPFYSYTVDGWVVTDIDEYKEHIKELLQTYRDTEISKDILYNGKYIQVRNTEDIGNIQTVKETLDDESTVDWLTADNTLLTVSKEDLSNILEAYNLRKVNQYSQYVAEKVYLQNAETVSDIQTHFNYLL